MIEKLLGMKFGASRTTKINRQPSFDTILCSHSLTWKGPWKNGWQSLWKTPWSSCLQQPPSAWMIWPPAKGKNTPSKPAQKIQGQIESLRWRLLLLTICACEIVKMIQESCFTQYIYYNPQIYQKMEDEKRELHKKKLYTKEGETDLKSKKSTEEESKACSCSQHSTLH